MKPEAGWYPVKLEARPGGSAVLHWQNLASVDFSEPFFEDTMRYHRGSCPFLRTEFPAEDFPVLPPPVLPAALIFHASRSGSTLLTQYISCLPGGFGLSEPPVIDDVLQASLPDEMKITLLRHVVHALCQRRSPDDRYFILKHDSWHLPWLPLLQQAFPGMPCWFIYRRPEEILWSHYRQRGSHMVPGLRDSAPLGILPGSFDPADLDGYAALVLESVFAQAMQHVSNGFLLPLEYRRLAQDPVGVLLKMGLPLTSTEEAIIRDRSCFHSKRTGEAFHPNYDSTLPSSAWLARVHDLIMPRLSALYENLSAMAPPTPATRATIPAVNDSRAIL